MLDSLGEIDPFEWDRLAGTQPFLRHAFLHALETSGCASRRTGWIARHLTLWRDGTLVGAVPLYEKTHSRGEYVFDWAWADAYARHGLPYYPKLVCAVPFSPIPGPRILAHDAATRAALIDTLLDFARLSDASSLHILFPCANDVQALRAAGMQIRDGVQFHWRNDGWDSFDCFLDSLARDKRKKIRQERRRVREAGIALRWLRGAEIEPQHWRFFHRCYVNTYRARGHQPYLSLEFFLALARSIPDCLLLLLAERDDTPIAAALNLCDGTALYGRYWGEVDHVPLLHFEACYYQGIEWCIEHGVERFEGGAQGEHKLARGLLPARTASAHWLRDERFAGAVCDYLARETAGVEQYLDELEEHSPFRLR